jgi:hypothetical protein
MTGETVSLAEKLKSTKRTEPGLPCGVGRILNQLTGEDKEALELVFASRSRSGTISNRQVHEILISEGHDVAFASIRLHRLQQCRCYIGKNGFKRQELSGGNA